MDTPTIVLAGVTGDLGGRIAEYLREHGATVRAIVRPASARAKTGRLQSLGVEGRGIPRKERPVEWWV
jgi:uncharacterized protein YbjT (DUF2867 family)